jgi:hypothetical protein
MKDLGMEGHIIDLFCGVPGTLDPAKEGLATMIRTALKKEEVTTGLGTRSLISFCKTYPLLGWHMAFRHSIILKFEKPNHQFIENIIKGRLGEDLCPTDDVIKIMAAEKSLKRYKLKGI